jgi:hypothetical protein
MAGSGSVARIAVLGIHNDKHRYKEDAKSLLLFFFKAGKVG